MEKQDITKYRLQIGIQFKMQREAQGWTVDQVATMADMKPATIEKIEAGVFNIPLDILVRVADVIGCEINIIMK